jgi:hypothetical protein
MGGIFQAVSVNVVIQRQSALKIRYTGPGTEVIHSSIQQKSRPFDY